MTKKETSMVFDLEKPEYSIVVPCYNKFKFTKTCLESVIEVSKDYDYEIVVVANGCTDETEQYVLQLQKNLETRIVLCSYRRPIGGGEAINVGFKLARGEYLVTINNDCKIMGKEWLSLLRGPFDLDPSVAVTGPLELKFPEINSSFIVFFCAMTRRKILDRIGYLDTETFKIGGCEDIDFCERAKRSGFRIQQVPPEPPVVVEKTTIDEFDDQWRNGSGKEVLHLNAGNFPIFHSSEGTVHDPNLVQNWSEILGGNRMIILNRYLPIDMPASVREEILNRTRKHRSLG